jgi:hypothetical protein
MRCHHRELSESRAEHSKAVSGLAAAAESMDATKASAGERLKRFNLINSQFKKREAGLQQQLQEAQTAAASAEAELHQILFKASQQDQVCLLQYTWYTSIRNCNACAPCLIRCRIVTSFPITCSRTFRGERTSSFALERNQCTLR